MSWNTRLASVPEVLRHHRRALVPVGRVRDRDRIARLEGQRLFYDDVATGRQGLLGKPAMGRRRRHDQDDVGLVASKGLAERRMGRDADRLARPIASPFIGIDNGRQHKPGLTANDPCPAAAEAAETDLDDAKRRLAVAPPASGRPRFRRNGPHHRRPGTRPNRLGGQ
jgi:hypothetical protein